MKSEIITTGTELLLGQITDTNASYIASELPLLGIDLYWISQVGDNPERLLEVLRRAWERSDLIITTGGLGPSEGDITRRCIAALVGEKITIDPLLGQRLEERFRRDGRKMAPSNLKQASIIPSAQAIPNSRGTAPGWWLEKEGRTLVTLPGPPEELRNMWLTEVKPRIKARITEGVIVSRTLKTWGISESVMNEMLLPMFSGSNPTLAIYVKADGIHVRLTAKAGDETAARTLIAPAESQVRAALGEAIWGNDEDTMEGMITAKLLEKGLCLAVVETFTGGELVSAITSAPDAPSCFKGGIALTSEDAISSFGIKLDSFSASAVSPEAASALAGVARFDFGSDIGIGMAGFSDKVGASTETGKVYIALADRSRSKVVGMSHPRDRTRVKRWVVSATLFELIKMLTREDYFSR
ncbi:MAG: CinA family nicotinamide mononucleotide deamidase-related protein [Chloroflexota bacterium]